MEAHRRLAYLGLGSNLSSAQGTPLETLRAALNRLGDEARFGPGARVHAVSSFYETEPVGVHDQPLFVNAAAALKTPLPPLELLDAMLELEREFGRFRDIAKPKGPRTLDLDLLVVEGVKLDLQRLKLPHPGLAARRFVLAPLAEIAPTLRPPGLELSVAELLARLPDEGETRIAGTRRLLFEGPR